MSLPDLIQFHGDWERYLDEIYRIYLKEIVYGRLKFRGLKITARRHPETRGKSHGFWHCIQEGNLEEGRLPDLRRCERIRWIAWAIRNAENDNRISWWIEKRGQTDDVVIWIEEENYLVVLSNRKRYYLLKTAYVADRPHKIESLKRKSKKRGQDSKND